MKSVIAFCMAFAVISQTASDQAGLSLGFSEFIDNWDPCAEENEYNIDEVQDNCNPIIADLFTFCSPVMECLYSENNLIDDEYAPDIQKLLRMVKKEIDAVGIIIPGDAINAGMQNCLSEHNPPKSEEPGIELAEFHQCITDLISYEALPKSIK